MQQQLILPDVPVGDRRSVRIGNRRLNVWVAGTRGPVVVLIHGLPSNHLLWRDVVPALAAHARVIAVDLLGYGASDVPAGKPVDIVAQAGYIAELLDEFDVERATVVGHDIGGGVAQILAVQRRALVGRLALIDAVCYDIWPVLEARLLRRTAPLVAHTPAALVATGLKLGLQRGFVNHDRGAAWLDLFLTPFSSDAGVEVLLEHVRSLSSAPTELVAPLLPTLAVPVAVIWGAQDPFLKPAYGERLARDIPGAELTLIEQASHFSPVDAPAEVADALLRLLARPARAP